MWVHSLIWVCTRMCKHFCVSPSPFWCHPDYLPLVKCRSKTLCRADHSTTFSAPDHSRGGKPHLPHVPPAGCFPSSGGEGLTPWGKVKDSCLSLADPTCFHRLNMFPTVPRVRLSRAVVDSLCLGSKPPKGVINVLVLLCICCNSAR